MNALVDWRFIVAAIIAVQFLVFAVRSIVSKEPKPKEGLRSAEFSLIVSSIVLIGGWFVAFGGVAMVRSSKSTKKVEASVAQSSTRGSCASVRIGMAGAKVRAVMGEPDQREKEDDVRGPGSERWIYSAARCQVHLFENVVEFVD
ncbi:MAG TPA: hypothetical protein VIL97_04830 [Thermoanaerobaculia bacterium]